MVVSIIDGRIRIRKACIKNTKATEGAGVE